MKKIIALLFILACSSLTFGASFVVNNQGDTSDANLSDGLCLDSNGNCTLRAAVEQANALSSDDAIAFVADIILIALTNEITINNAGSLTVNGRGANVMAIDGGAGLNRIFFINAATVTISNLTIQGGNGGTSSSVERGRGGAILASGGSLTLDTVVVQNNGGGANTPGEGTVSGCGVSFNQGTHRIMNSTFRNNRCSQSGAFSVVAGSVFMANSTISGNASTIEAPVQVPGGGAVINNGALTIVNSTIVRNTATGSGGGVHQSHINGGFTFVNTIIAENTAPQSPDIFSLVNAFSHGNNLIGNTSGTSVNFQSTDIRNVSPRLGFLRRDNGGTTPTHALLSGSPAIDKGNNLRAVDFNNAPLPFDQRGSGFPRIVDGDNNGVATVDIGAYELQTSAPNRTRYDYDGDGRADIAVFRPSNGIWYILRSQNNSFYAVQFGQAGDQIAPADYDGDGRTDIAVFRDVVPGAGNSAYFYILNSSDNSFRPVQFGATGDVPVPGDWDGDGKDDLAVYRAASAAGGQSYFYYRPSLQPTVNYYTLPHGTAGDKPVVGDFDGDGRLDPAVFRPSNAVWYILRSSVNQLTQITFGLSTDVPTAADFDGDGQTNVAVFRPLSGTWFTSTNPQNNYGAIQFGMNGDVPVPADYDGDGKADVAVFRPSNGAWYLNRSTQGFIGVQFGASEDKPIPNAFIR